LLRLAIREADVGFFYKTDELGDQNMPALTHILYSQMILYDLFPVFKKRHENCLTPDR
jgi:hypothetical protein